MKKQNMSAAFFFMALFVILSIQDIIGMLTNAGTQLQQQFSIAGIFGYAVNLVSALIPAGLLVLLYLNTQQNVKKMAWIAMLVAGALELYALLRYLMTMPMLLSSGAEIFEFFPQIASMIICALMGTMMIFGAMGIRSGKKPKLVRIALVCGFIYLIPAGFSVIIGRQAALAVLKDIIMLAALCVLPATFIDRESAPMVNKGFLRTIAWALVIVLVVMGISALLVDNSNQKAGQTAACKYCHREFTDSGNKRSIAKTGMCSNCAGNYEDLSDWVDQMDG